MPIAPPPQITQEHARRWQDADAARAYKFRPAYTPETFELLCGLIADAPMRVLDIGCGTGNLSRALAPFVAQVDAIDLSADMIAEARALPGGDAANISWRCARAEDVVLDQSYALIVGGESLHWMDAEIVLPKFARALTPRGVLAVVKNEEPIAPPWAGDMLAVIKRHSTAPNHQPWDMITAWREAGLFEVHGEAITLLRDSLEPVADYIAAFHGMSTLTRAHIDAPAFDAEAAAVLAPHCPDGLVRRRLGAHIVWGRPRARA